MSDTQLTGRPLWGNCLVRVEAIPTKTKSGIELPDNAPKGNTLTGKVIAAGSGSIAFDGSPIPMEVEPGTRVIFKVYEAEPVSVGGESLYLVDQRQIIFVYHV